MQFHHGQLLHPKQHHAVPVSVKRPKFCSSTLQHCPDNKCPLCQNSRFTGGSKETDFERLVVLEMIGVSDWLVFVGDNGDD